jgi:GDP-L-fucose synthase
MIHLAAFSGNLNFNQQNRVKTYRDNILIGLNTFTAWKQVEDYNKKILGITSKALNVIPSCAYPDIDNLTEDKLYDGKCHSTIESHGLARRAVEGFTRQLNQDGSRIITCVVNNSFGPYDSFDPEKTKVVGGMIKRFVDAIDNKLETVTCWGSGNVTRTFIFSEDVAKCLLLALDSYEDYEEPINICSGQSISIKELAETIADIVGYEGKIEWDTTKPDGQNQKTLNREKFIHNFGNITFTPLRKGLESAISYYKYMKGTGSNVRNNP